MTRLLVKDGFPLVRIPRERIEAWAGRDPRFEAIGDLATCSWCASGWVAMALVAAVDLFSDTPVPLPPVLWAAVWAVAALIAWAEGRLEPDGSKTLPAVVHLTPAGWAAPDADPVGDMRRYAEEERRRYEADPLGPEPAPADSGWLEMQSSNDTTARIGTTGLVDMGVPAPVGSTRTGPPEDYDG